MRSKNLPGLSLAASVIVAAVIALLLINGPSAPDGGLPPATGDGQSLQLLPGGGEGGHAGSRLHRPGGEDAARAQYGPPEGEDASRAQYGLGDGPLTTGG